MQATCVRRITCAMLCVSAVLAADRCYGGYARISTIVSRARANGPVLVLNAGDDVTGTPFNPIYNGNESYPFLNAIGFDAFVSPRGSPVGLSVPLCSLQQDSTVIGRC